MQLDKSPFRVRQHEGFSWKFTHAANGKKCASSAFQKKHDNPKPTPNSESQCPSAFPGPAPQGIFPGKSLMLAGHFFKVAL